MRKAAWIKVCGIVACCILFGGCDPSDCDYDYDYGYDSTLGAYVVGSASCPTNGGYSASSSSGVIICSGTYYLESGIAVGSCS